MAHAHFQAQFFPVLAAGTCPRIRVTAALCVHAHKS
eukprot:COSAG01_NODE_58078_length_308_cov_0.889952_1_plen_35_part_01